ncbi:MAG: SpoIIIAH-like family protein [Oscillospiraceae bacterium]|jgi:stage III sporulation protein AH|nr:SpoIIIAH-like family protein [Oscillospiraceae bacterium]
MAYFGKRQVVLAALVVALGAAIYLNWQLSDKDLTSTKTANYAKEKELGEAKFVNNNLEDEKNADGSKSSDNDSGSNDNALNSELLTKTKQDRQKSREETTRLIKDTLKDASSNESVKKEAIKQMGEFAKTIELESNLEAIIKAKTGAENCIVFIHGDKCSVILSLKIDGKIAVNVSDAVKDQGGFLPSNIKIMGVDD